MLVEQNMAIPMLTMIVMDKWFSLSTGLFGLLLTFVALPQRSAVRQLLLTFAFVVSFISAMLLMIGVYMPLANNLG